MSGATSTMASWEFRGAARSRWVLGTAISFAALSLAVTLLGMRSLRELGLTGVGPASAALINLGILLPSLMGLLLGGNAIVAAREQGVLAMVAAQPISRNAIVLGAFVGLEGALGATIVLGFGAAALVLSGVARSSDLMPLAALIGSALLVASACVSLGLALSAYAHSRMQSLSIAISVWFMLALGMDLALAAIAPSIHMGPSGLLAAILLNPLEAGRVLALLGASPDGTVLGPFGAYLVERFGSVGAAALLCGSLVVWTIIPLVIARRSLAKRDI